MLGLREALRLYFDEGAGRGAGPPPGCCPRRPRRACEALGLELSGEYLDRAWAVTAVKAPEGIDGDALVAKVRADHRIILAPGQGPMKGKVFRIGHLGYYDRFDIIRCLAALELTLRTMGYPVQARGGGRRRRGRLRRRGRQARG